MNEEYKTNSGETIALFQDGLYYIVECYDECNETRWTKMFRKENEARVEFEKWRS